MLLLRWIFTICLLLLSNRFSFLEGVDHKRKDGLTATYVFSPTQLNAMYELYNSTNGMDWKYKKGVNAGSEWDFSTTNPNPCISKWQGVTCNSATVCTNANPCNVLGLSLTSFNLRGSIPDGINALSYLQTLVLDSNTITNTIPATLGNITPLTEINLSNNHINGTIPSELSQLSELQQLILSVNFLSGNIPDDIFLSNTRLTTLSINNNFLSGNLSSSIGSLKNLLDLDLSNNFLTGTISNQIRNCSLLQQLLLNNNLFTGSFPVGLTYLTWLENLDLKENKLVGSLPDSFHRMRSLESLTLSFNRFSAELPNNSFAQMESLTSIALNHNYFAGSLPRSLLNCSKLTSINFNNNNFTGRIWESIERLSHLESLTLSANALTGPLPDNLTQLSALTELDVSDNQLEAPLPDNLQNLTALTTLDLSNNHFQGTLPASINSLAKIQSFNAGRNFFSGSLPFDSGVNILPSLEQLDLSSNLFNGTIPESLSALSILQSLKLGFNLLTGPIPDGFFSGFSLSSLQLQANLLTGSLPMNITPTSRLKELDVAYNNLSGSIPLEFSHLKLLSHLNLGGNHLTGTLSPTLCLSLYRLSDMVLSQNRLRGTIPEAISNLSRLNRFDISENDFTGTLPVTIARLSFLLELYLDGNELFGTIPIDILSNVTTLRFLDLRNNLFTGTISSQFFTAFPLLRVLRLASNSLIGMIPTDIDPSHSHAWEVIDFGSNFLNGTIPLALVNNRSYISTLLLSHNLFTGSIPPEVYTVEGLVQLDLSVNYLIGNFSETAMANMTRMFNFTVSDNYLTGSLPTTLVNARLLLQLYLQGNFFTGIIPSSYSQLTELENIDLSANELVGSISPSFSSWRKLITLNLSSNHLTGSISGVFNELPYLQTIFVSNNQLTGTIDQLINGSHQLTLNSIDISSNQFTGSLPPQLFNQTPSLISFASIKNCFTGTIPVEICSASQLTALALDGLHSSDACIQRVLPLSRSKSYVIPTTLKGSIPYCLFQMPVLQVLHLSGNGLTGSLPLDTTISASLSDLSLSHNKLFGKIPINFQVHPWTNLDLSFNKFTDLLSSDLTVTGYVSWNGSLTLDINRLSGSIPSQLQDLDNIDILKGNLFACDALFLEGTKEKSSIPSHDSNADSYTCGSNTVNLTLISWLVIIMIPFVVILFVMSCWYYFPESPLSVTFRKLREKLQIYWKVYQLPVIDTSQFSNNKEEEDLEESRTSKKRRSSFFPAAGERRSQRIKRASRYHDWFYIYDLGLVLSGIRQLSWYAAWFTVLVLLPFHIGLSNVYGTYTYQYAWILSMGFMTGLVPAVVFLILLWMFLGFLQSQIKFLMDTYYFEQSSKHSLQSLSMIASATSTKGTTFFPRLQRKSLVQLVRGNLTSKLVWTFLLLAIINCLVVLAVQFSYVLALTNEMNHSVLTIVSLGVSLFGVFWNNVMVIGMFSIVVRNVQKEVPILPKLAAWFTIPHIRITSLNHSRSHSRSREVTAATNSVLSPAHHQTENRSDLEAPPAPSTLSGGSESIDLSHQPSSTSTSSVISAVQLTSEKEVFDEERRIFFLTLLLLFNNVAAPIAASAFADANCFYYLLITPPEVETTYEVSFCTEYVNSLLYEGRCFAEASYPQTIHYTPPFLYSYQCSSSLLTSFAYIFLIRYIFIGVILPCHRLMMKAIQEYYYWHYLVVDGKKQDYLFVWINLNLHVPLRVLSPRETAPTTRTSSAVADRVSLLPKVNASFLRDAKRTINRDYIVLPIISEFTVLLTFGAVFPPLAIAACFTIIMNSVFTQVMIGRVVAIATIQQELQAVLPKMNEECRNFRRLFLQSIPSISFLAAGFWGFFLFDILGDASESSSAIWILLVMGVAPMVLYGLEVVWTYSDFSNSDQSDDKKDRPITDSREEGEGGHRRNQRSSRQTEVELMGTVAVKRNTALSSSPVKPEEMEEKEETEDQGIRESESIATMDLDGGSNSNRPRKSSQRSVHFSDSESLNSE